MAAAPVALEVIETYKTSGNCEVQEERYER
jgi:hypothetical protein